ncbi:MAG TPA: hypothetical protein VI316_01005 [Candidatus Dormibacteraeota bacterium]
MPFGVAAMPTMGLLTLTFPVDPKPPAVPKGKTLSRLIANDQEQLLEIARNYLKEASARRSDARWMGSDEALASIAASLLVPAGPVSPAEG